MKFSELTALYSPLDIEYSQVMSGPYEEFAYRGDNCEIIAGLKDGRLSGFWRPMIAAGDEKVLDAKIKYLWNEISNNWYYMDFLVNGELSVVSRFLLKREYRAKPVYTQIIDLTLSKEELHLGLRKSYKSLVNKIEDVRTTYHVAPTSIVEAVRKIYQGTRDERTWDIQARMLCESQAYCIMSPDTYALIYCNDYVAYYASGRGKGNAHAVLWVAILEAKRRGCKVFELGEQVFSGDEKRVNISAFKRGFGGRTVTRLILESS